MGSPGYQAVIRISGSETATTGNQMSTVAGATAFTAGTLWQIDSTAREVWERTIMPTFRDGATTIAAADIVYVNYLHGRVQFTSTYSTVFVDMTFLPLSDIAGAHTYTLVQSNDMLDDTDFSSTGFRSRFPGLQDVTLSINRYEKLDGVFDSVFFDRGTAATSIGSTNYIDGNQRLVADVRPGGSTNPCGRGFMVLETDNISADVSSLEDADISLLVDGDTAIAFRWSDLLP